MKSIRLSCHRLIWGLLWPIRTYFNYFPVHRGKGVILRWILLPSLPPKPITFPWKLPCGATIDLFYRESMGLKMLLFGTYESVEISTLCKHAKPGSMAIDVGANIGICTLEFSAAVGEEGMVLAIEPHPETAARLRENLSRNGIKNVLVKEVCATNFDGTIDLVLSNDPTLHSTVNVPPDAMGASLTLPATRIDEMWGNLGRPLVSVLKIDVEGAEFEVLSGSDMLLTDQHPSILLEASSPERLKKISDLLSRYGYAAEQPKGFESRDFLFIHKDLAHG